MEKLKSLLKNIPLILLIIVTLSTGVISFSANSYRVSIDFNYGKILPKLNEVKEETIKD